MFDIGLSELAVIALVGLVIIGPKDLPVVARYIVAFIRELRGIAAKVNAQVMQVAEENGLSELNTRTIIDLDGKPQIAYDVSELEGMQAAPKPDAHHD